ncbi:MAG: hypothetical protein Q9170_007570 [Blastenia crenularia]
MVWRLNVTTQQKIALTATFLHGIIGFIASIARLVILFEPIKARNTNCELAPFLSDVLSDKTAGLAISWTIWTIVEPTNFVIAACLPTLRPVFARILPPSFFLLTNKRKSRPYTSLKISWPKGRATPKITLASADIHGPSRLTGPWDQSGMDRGDLEANNMMSLGKSAEKTFTQNTREITPSPPALL